ncbi:FtsH protease activity modulator HflK [Trinickia dabaoshanensis]|uniref:Protein HflK n=1 Tax=Trinickia dabaoshanensis TaxID=564714 RepID=A0A2N7VLC3_9BURK|nr:FtsH protease activity modulator HflK [Trinickia dabaoshanensis]PMS17943.1 FtsH protease activity modulator HflK [Trinickia dabaoshanensis]
MNEYNERSFWLRARAILSISDPRWGRGDGNGSRQRPNEPKRGPGDGDGPPDLDEMWREFNRRLSRLFGGNKGSGPGDRRPDNGRAARIGVGIVIGVLVAIYIGSGVFVVQDGQTGIVLQFGKYRATVEPGVHLRMPYPFETHEIVNVAQIRSVEIGRGNAMTDASAKDASVLTRDGDIVDVRLAVQYQVKSATDYLFRTADPDLAVNEAAHAAVREIVGAQSTESLLGGNRDALREPIMQSIQKALDLYHSGLAVTGVTVMSIEPPSAVLSAYADATRARQDRANAKAQAQAYAGQILPGAKAQAQRSIDDAKAYAARVVSDAQGDAERFNQVYAQYAKAPAVVRERMYLETMRDIYANSTKIFVSGKAGGSVVNLSVDKLLEANRRASSEAGGPAAASAASAASVAAAPSAAPSPAEPNAASQAAAASDAMRSRDTLRSRAREDDLQQ